MPSIDHILARAWVRAYDGLNGQLSKVFSYGLYDGRNFEKFREAEGDVPVLFAIPPMSDVNGALPHPGVRVLQAVMRHEGFRCEVINYNLPVIRPRSEFDHLIGAIRALDVKILGVSLYSQAIGNTLHGLRAVKAACPELTIVLGGPHPTESYLSLLGVSFIDYICRSEAEESFPQLVRAVLAGKTPAAGEIPGVYRYNRDTDEIEGVAAPFSDLAVLDRNDLLRYQFSPDEIRQQQRYRGAHGTAGAEYWPVALVRGCPYDCTFCAAYQMSGKKLRYRAVNDVVDDLQFFSEQYGRKHFSFIDDAFTQQYDYVIDLCQEIVRRKLDVYWTTDNGIRYETLGSGKPLEAYLKKKDVASVDELIALMIQAGWRGTAIGIESGAPRVRRELVRKGGAHLTNDEIVANLVNLKKVAQEQGVYFYINGFLMAGFPRLPLPNGKIIPAETKDEMNETRQFARRLRDSGAIDIMNLSMVIPLPGTDMWNCLTIKDKLHVFLSAVPRDHPGRAEIEAIQRRVLEQYGDDLDATRYREEPEVEFWKAIYKLPDLNQIAIMQSYDAFNADAAHEIDLERPDREFLWEFRESVVSEFYGSSSMKFRMLKHVVKRSSGLQDVAAYLTLLGRKLVPTAKVRPVANV